MSKFLPSDVLLHHCRMTHCTLHPLLTKKKRNDLSNHGGPGVLSGFPPLPPLGLRSFFARGGESGPSRRRPEALTGQRGRRSRGESWARNPCLLSLFYRSFAAFTRGVRPSISPSALWPRRGPGTPESPGRAGNGRPPPTRSRESGASRGRRRGRSAGRGWRGPSSARPRWPAYPAPARRTGRRARGARWRVGLSRRRPGRREDQGGVGDARGNKHPERRCFTATPSFGPGRRAGAGRRAEARRDGAGCRPGLRGVRSR